MKKVIVAVTLLLAVAGTTMAQNDTPAPKEKKDMKKDMPAKKHHKKHHGKKADMPAKPAEEKKMK